MLVECELQIKRRCWQSANYGSNANVGRVRTTDQRCRGMEFCDYLGYYDGTYHYQNPIMIMQGEQDRWFVLKVFMRIKELDVVCERQQEEEGEGINVDHLCLDVECDLLKEAHKV